MGKFILYNAGEPGVGEQPISFGVDNYELGMAEIAAAQRAGEFLSEKAGIAIDGAFISQFMKARKAAEYILNDFQPYRVAKAGHEALNPFGRPNKNRAQYIRDIQIMHKKYIHDRLVRGESVLIVAHAHSLMVMGATVDPLRRITPQTPQPGELHLFNVVGVPPVVEFEKAY
jgi:bisphosphoglycerate-dependent phosphoglycerate mutase